MKIFVQDINTNKSPIEVNPSDSVEKLKEKINAKIGVLPHEQKLLFSGKFLEDGKILADYNVQENEIIYLVPSPSGSNLVSAFDPLQTMIEKMTSIENKTPVSAEYLKIDNNGSFYEKISLNNGEVTLTQVRIKPTDESHSTISSQFGSSPFNDPLLGLFNSMTQPRQPANLCLPSPVKPNESALTELDQTIQFTPSNTFPINGSAPIGSNQPTYQFNQTIQFTPLNRQVNMPTPFGFNQPRHQFNQRPVNMPGPFGFNQPRQFNQKMQFSPSNNFPRNNPAPNRFNQPTNRFNQPPWWTNQ